MEDGLANWPVDADGDLVGEDGQIRVQWCMGGPGVVCSAAGYLDEELLLAGDERWLERARRFAVHALGQVERGRAARGRGRYSLWTGDLGVALYAADCLDARAAFPVVDSWS